MIFRRQLDRVYSNSLLEALQPITSTRELRLILSSMTNPTTDVTNDGLVKKTVLVEGTGDVPTLYARCLGAPPPTTLHAATLALHANVLAVQ